MEYLTYKGTIELYKTFNLKKDFQKSKLATMKDKIRMICMQVLKEEGINGVKAYIDDLYKQTTKRPEGAELRGELSEILLHCILQDFCDKHKDCCFIKNCCIPSRTTRTGFTELDLTLCTSKRVYLFESKSYKGKKKLIDECTLVSDLVTTDINAQNQVHLSNLNYLIGGCMDLSSAKKQRPYKKCLFTYADGQITDTRTKENKERYPSLDYDNIVEFLERDLASYKEKVWDVQKVYNLVCLFDKYSEQLFEKHLGGI